MTQLSKYDRPVSPAFVLAARAVFLGILVFITYQSLEPTISSVTITHMDKVMHALAYAVLTGLFALAMPRLKLVYVFLGPAVYGAFIEVAQAMMPYGRTGTFWDFVANITGSGFMILVWVLFISAVYRLKSRKSPAA